MADKHTPDCGDFYRIANDYVVTCREDGVIPLNSMVVACVDAEIPTTALVELINRANAGPQTAADRDRLAQEVERLRELIRSTADRLFLPIDDQPRERLREKLLAALAKADEQS